MFVRITTYRLKPEYDNEENLRKIQVELADKLKGLPGLKEALQLAGKDGEKHRVVAMYYDEDAANASRATVRKEWAEYEYLLAEKPEIEEYGQNVPTHI